MGDLPCPDIRAVNTILTIGGSPLFCKYYVYPIKKHFTLRERPLSSAPFF